VLTNLEGIKKPMHIRKIILLLIVSVTNLSFGQGTNNEQEISVGIYGVAYPTKFHPIIHTGILVDRLLPKTKRLYSSSSINYLGFYKSYGQYYYLSVTSGLSWNIENDRFCFRPGIQLGYLRQQRGHIFNGLFLRGSSEFTYKLSRFEGGLHFNYGIGYGPTNYINLNPYDYLGPVIQNKLGLMWGCGLLIKYSFFKP
jgi:hypothetical protein